MHTHLLIKVVQLHHDLRAQSFHAQSWKTGKQLPKDQIMNSKQLLKGKSEG